MKIQRTENCNKALAFLKAAKIKLVGIGSGDIEGGNEKLILGLLWPVKISRSIFTHWGFRVGAQTSDQSSAPSYLRVGQQGSSFPRSALVIL